MYNLRCSLLVLFALTAAQHRTQCTFTHTLNLFVVCLAQVHVCKSVFSRPACAQGRSTMLPCRSGSWATRLQAAAQDKQAEAPASEAGPSGRGGLVFGKDTESLSDVFAFAGPAPEVAAQPLHCAETYYV